MKKRIGQPDRRRKDFDGMKPRIKVSEYDENDYEGAISLFDDELSEEDDRETLAVVVSPNDHVPHYCVTLMQLEKLTQDEIDTVGQLSIGFLFLFLEMDEDFPVFQLSQFYECVDSIYGLKERTVMKRLSSLFEKGVRLRILVPVPTETYERHRKKRLKTEKEAS